MATSLAINFGKQMEDTEKIATVRLDCRPSSGALGRTAKTVCTNRMALRSR